MADAPYTAVHLSDIPLGAPPEEGSFEWRPVRHHLDIQSFGINAMTAVSEGDWVVPDHTEVEESQTRHEELFFVASGRATFTVGEESFEAPAGTFVYVPDPEVRRSARALEAGTTVVAVGAEPGVAFTVSAWEDEYLQ